MILATANVLQDARHAVLRTLYSRAHRIVLDGISYLLLGLCKRFSLDLFCAVPVGVLACPALELLVLLEQQLEGLADDVGRVCVNEFRIPVQVISDCFDGAFRSAKCFSSFRYSRCITSCITK